MKKLIYIKRRPYLFFNGAFVLLLLFIIAAERLPARLSAQSTSAQSTVEPTSQAADERASQAAVRPTTPTKVSTSSSAVALAKKADQTIDESAFASARWGVYFMSLRDGRVVYARDGDRPFTPASNMKVYTTAVALDQLGADYRWRTSVYAEKEADARGTISGDLILYGRGAPDLTTRAKGNEPDHLAQLAEDLYKRGVRRVRGDLIGDESFLRGEALGDGWLWNDVQWYFGAEVSALTVNGNETTVTITPGKPGEAAGAKFDPENSYFHLTNDATTATRGSSLTIGVTRGLSDNNLRVWGEFPASGRNYSVRVAVHQPALWAVTLFREQLRARGITIEGKTGTRDARVSPDERFDPQRFVELASVTSKSLGEIVRSTNKHSINLYAELLLRTLGRERGETAPDPDPVRMRIRGDDEAGLSVVRQWLERTAATETAGLSLHDGSGLSRLDIVTPEVTARLLAAIAQTPSAKVFRDSLPIAGRDGTLAGRLGVTGGRLQAKTGTLSYNNSLSGYLTAADDEQFAFAIFCNDETARGSSTSVIDAIARLLAEYRESGS